MKPSTGKIQYNTAAYEFVLSPQHTKIRFIGHILKISYLLDFGQKQTLTPTRIKEFKKETCSGWISQGFFWSQKASEIAGMI